jgi:hypothetical protein
VIFIGFQNNNPSALIPHLEVINFPIISITHCVEKSVFEMSFKIVKKTPEEIMAAQKKREEEMREREAKRKQEVT